MGTPEENRKFVRDLVAKKGLTEEIELEAIQIAELREELEDQ